MNRTYLESKHKENTLNGPSPVFGDILRFTSVGKVWFALPRNRKVCQYHARLNFHD